MRIAHSNDNQSTANHKLQSILKIDSLNDPLISSIKKYINADQNPSKIKKDMKLWENHGLGEALERIIQCHENIN